MTISFNFSKISPLITDNTLILTPNTRTQKAIITGQLLACPDQQVFESLNIRSFSQWQDDLWSELSFFKVLPKRVSNLTIKTWLENEISNEPDWILTNPSGVANKVLEAYKNMVLWGIDLNQLNALSNRDDDSNSDASIDGQSTEVNYFIKWITKLETFFKDKNLIAPFTHLKLLQKHFSLIKKCLPEKLLLIGFNELNPLEQLFLDRLSCENEDTNQTVVQTFNNECKPQSEYQLSFASFEDELNFAAQFAVDFSKNESQSEKSLAIVVNQLANHLPAVHQVFSEAFHPNESKPWVELGKPNYNVSAGLSLADSPLIKVAFLILNLNAYQLKLEELHFLKNTPFINWGECKKSIQHFLHQLSLNTRKSYSINFILAEIDKTQYANELTLLRSRLVSLTESSQHQRSIEQYTKEWKNKLYNWQWGVETSQANKTNEAEALAKQMLLELIDESLELNVLGESCTQNEALDYLTQLIKQKTFQMASDRNEVHILGVLEASGLPFEQLLLVGFNNTNWPQKNKINPFLPLELQREFNMAGNSADREYEYAKDLSNSLLKSAKNIIVTSNYSDGNEAVRWQSSAPFFAHLNAVSVEEQFPNLLIPSSTNDINSDYEWVDDSIVDLSHSVIKGGAYLLSDYAKCPFKSMTNFQLRLKHFEPAEIGIEPKIRGSWLHDAMELIWETLATQKKLIEMPLQQLKELVDESLISMLKKHQAYLLAVTDEAVIQIELNKLSQLILEWCEIDKQRDSFKVDSLEKKYTLSFSDLSFSTPDLPKSNTTVPIATEMDLNFRVDRIDINANNQLEIIDYKTGKTELKNWFGVRPTEAQMPAYVLAMKDQEIANLSYARIKTGEVTQVGLDFDVLVDHETTERSTLKVERALDSLKKTALEKTKIANVTATRYASLIEQWQLSLQRMAVGISGGYMPVSPKDKVLTCQYCDYQSFCRITEGQAND